ncbi:MAG: alpha-amylase family glycosyl hydrolase [Ferruginibacter sp.]
MNFFLMLCTWLLISCGKDDLAPYVPPAPPVTPPVIVADSTPVQYGIPFSEVTDRQDAVIYQVNMRAFSAAGNFAGVTARLDSIKSLGANIVYLMPIYPVGIVKAVNSPYCIKDYQAINSEFGTLADLRALVDAAHSRKMSVMLDWVANHTAWDHGWISTHKDWYLQDGTGNVVSPPGMGWTDVAQLNFTNAAMRLEMIKSMKYWVYTANIDGFRCDYTDGPPVDFWKQAIDTLRNISTHKLLLLAEGQRTTNFSAGFDYNFAFGFFGNLKSVYSNNKSVLSIDSMNNVEYANSANGQQVVRYITNHDVNGSDGTPLELFGAARGSMAAFAVVALMKSVPMIYNGQETGNTTRLTFPFTTTKVNWAGDYAMEAEYKKIIAFRNSSAAVRRGNLTGYSSADICAFTKELAGEKILVIANLRNNTINYTMPTEIANTAWQDAMNGGSKNLATQINLAPYEYWVLKL